MVKRNQEGSKLRLPLTQGSLWSQSNGHDSFWRISNKLPPLPQYISPSMTLYPSTVKRATAATCGCPRLHDRWIFTSSRPSHRIPRRWLGVPPRLPEVHTYEHTGYGFCMFLLRNVTFVMWVWISVLRGFKELENVSVLQPGRDQIQRP